ncbi:MAG: hypothetical protein V1906_00470 [Candidatus Woesearchaeota archaeon]
MGDFSVLACRIVDMGFENADLSMLPEDKRAGILTDVAVLLRKKNETDSAVKALAMSGNTQMLREWELDFLTLKDSKHAAVCAIASNDLENLEKVGMMCVADGYYELAIDVFRSAGKTALVNFVKANYL